mgnify:CR=1 FL=1
MRSQPVKKSGGIFVPPHEAVIHQYMREMIVKSGDMSIVSDSHTHYGTQGSLSIGEGGPELAKAMLGKYYEIDYPEVIAVVFNRCSKAMGRTYGCSLKHHRKSIQE